MLHLELLIVRLMVHKIDILSRTEPTFALVCE